MRGKERGKHDLVLVKTGKPCNKSHAKENPNACCKVGQTLDEAGVARFQGVGAAAESRAPAATLTIRRLEAQLTEAQAKIAELRASAETDFLLDILNRRGFARELTRAVAIDQLTFVFRDINVSAGASAGAALLGPDADGEAALVQADKAMYERKTA